MSDQLTAFTVTLQNAATATGNGTVMNCGGLAAVLMQLEGWGTATVTFEGLVNDGGGNFNAVEAQLLGSGAWATTAAANGLYLVPASGLSQVRARISAYTSGTLTVTGKGIPAGMVPVVLNLNAKGGLLASHQNSDKATFVASVQGVANTASADIVAVEAGASKVVRIRKVVLVNPGAQTTAGLRNLQLLRTTAAGTGGAVTPAAMDAADAFSGTVREAPSGLGAAGTVLFNLPVWVPTTVGTFTPVALLDFTNNIDKAPLIAAGVTNGAAVRDPGATGASGLALWVEFSEEAN